MHEKVSFNTCSLRRRGDECFIQVKNIESFPGLLASIIGLLKVVVN